MIIRFKEVFDLPIEEVYSYFATPADWPRLFGLSGKVRDLGDGWFAVPVRRFPFPLVAKNTRVESNRFVRWEFGSFWRGVGEVTFAAAGGRVVVEGFERIAVRWLFFLSPLVEKMFLDRPFRAIWNGGWRRLHRIEQDRQTAKGGEA